jgi:SAM-dependent methyltransferase
MSAAGAGASGETAALSRRRRLDHWARVLSIWMGRVRRWLGVRRGTHVDGVYYKELTSESLTRALSRRGSGFKDYRVTFPDRGGKMVIRCAHDQVFADLMGPVGIERLEPLLHSVRPGGRILEFNSGTGYRAFWLSFVVGPSGGVVAIATRPSHAEFASRRYARANIAFEIAEGFALAGETDGAFDAVVALDPQTSGTNADPDMLLRELWRLTAPGGVVLVGGITDAALEWADDVAEVQRLPRAAGTARGSVEPPADLLVRRRPAAEDRGR